MEDWGDRSPAPEPSWTLQFLSTYLDEAGRWQGQATPLAEVARQHWAVYFQDFESRELWQPGRTPFTETGLHFLEAMNKLCRRQGGLFPGYFSELKAHVGQRLRQSLADSQILLSNPDWPSRDYRDRVLEIALSQLLVLGHLLELCFHPQGALRDRWTGSESSELSKAAQTLAELMQLFFDPRIEAILSEEQRRAYPFPLLHAYHALALLA